MVARPSRRVLIAYCLVTLPVLIALSVEVGFALDHWLRDRAVRERQRENPFRAREVTEAFHDTLWDAPWSRYKPGAEKRFRVAGSEHHVAINSHGFRSDEFALEKPAGRIRIVAIGGSTTVQGRTNAETYPAHLQRLLRARFPDVDLEVLNLGVSGTRSGYWLTERPELFRLSPDIVVQYNAINDLAWQHLHELAIAAPLRKLLNRSHLMQWLFPLDPGRLDAAFAETHLNFLKLSRQSAIHRAHYLTGTFALAPYADSPAEFRDLLDADVSGEWGKAIALEGYPQFAALITRHNALLADFAKRHDLELVPIHERLRDPETFIDACHMTPDGIEQLAHAFLPEVSALVQPASR